jgi:hypothetical protein
MAGSLPDRADSLHTQQTDRHLRSRLVLDDRNTDKVAHGRARIRSTTPPLGLAELHGALFQGSVGTSAKAPAVVGNRCRTVCQSLVRGRQVRMIVNGVTVDDHLVLALAGAVKNSALAHKLRTARRFRTEVINLNNAERAMVLAALDDSTPELQELRVRLVEHPTWRPPTHIT